MELLRRFFCFILIVFVSLSAFANIKTVDAISLPWAQYWYKKITFEGYIQVSGFVSNVTPTTVGMLPSSVGSSPPASDLSVTLAFITAMFQPVDWLEAYLSLAYAQRSPSFVRGPPGGGDSFYVDRIYILFADPNCTPFYLKVGRYFLDFGGLEINSSYTESMTQLISLTRATQIAVGLDDYYGFNASAYIFSPLIQVGRRNTTRANAGGLNVSYSHQRGDFSFKLGAGAVSNMLSSLYITSTLANNSPLFIFRYHDRVAGLDLNGSVKIKQFDFSANYVAALNHFSVFDLPFTTDGGETLRGAEPSAFGVNAGYSFPVSCYDTRIGLGYQKSYESAAMGFAFGSVPYSVVNVYNTNFYSIGLELFKIYANYTITFTKFLTLGFEVAKDHGYSSKNGGTGRSAIIGMSTLIFMV